MSLFGGLSKAERRRIQVRTRASILALATDGRWLGGRPNYGYRLVGTGRPHANRSKAATWRPNTAPIVRRIFGMNDTDIGFRSIAQTLEGDGIPAPARLARYAPSVRRRVGGSAVRAILTNLATSAARSPSGSAGTMSWSTPATRLLARSLVNAGRKRARGRGPSRSAGRAPFRRSRGTE